MSITKTNNGYLVSTMYKGYRVKQMYYGYTKQEAKQLFINHLKTL
jgi:hypothetical protein